MKIKKYGVLFVFCLFLLFPTTVHASWTGESDTSIYTDVKDSEESESKEKDGKKKEKEDKKEVGTLEKMLSTVVISLSDGIQELLSFGDCSLDRIVLGRVYSGSKSSSMFTFELIKNNPYGTIASISYAILRGIIFTAMIFVFLQKVIKAAASNGSGQARAEFKGAMSQYGLSVLLLILMPYFFDLCIYIRNAVLYLLASQYSTLSGGDSLSLIEAFRDVAKSSNSITDALMYLGAVAITVWFIFEYVGMALATVLLFILFAFTALFSNYKKDALTSWVENTFSVLVTPVIDVTLLYLPILFSKFFQDAFLVRMALCAMIIPARRMAKNFLGLSSTGSGVLSAMGALFAARSLGNLGKKAAGGLSKIGNSIKNGKESLDSAKRHRELAEAEKADERDALQKAGFDINMQNTPENGYGAESFSTDKKAPKVFGKGFSKDDMGKKQDPDSELLKNRNYGNAQKEEDNDSEEIQSGDCTEKGMDEANIVYGKHRNGLNANGNTSSGMTAEQGMEQLREEKNGLETDNLQSRQNIAALRMEKSRLAKENADMEADDAENGFPGASKAAIAKNKSQMASLDNAIEKENANISRNNEKINEINNRMEALRSSGMQQRTGTYGNNGVSSRQQEILRKHANIDNFETPEFSGLSHQDKAVLYQKKAMKQFASAGTTAVGGVVGAGGAVVGAGAGMFYGPTAMAMGASAGGSITGSAASAGASAVVQTASYAANGIKNVTYSTKGKVANMSPTHPSHGNQPTQAVEPNVDFTNINADMGRNVQRYMGHTYPDRISPDAVQQSAAFVIQKRVKEMAANGESISGTLEKEMFGPISEGKTYEQTMEAAIRETSKKLVPDTEGNAQVVEASRNFSNEHIRKEAMKNEEYFRKLYEDILKVNNERL